MMRYFFHIAILCLGTTIIFPVQSSAQGLTVAGMIGNSNEDGYNFGFGGKAGATLPGSNLYLGGRAVFHQGTEINNADTKVQYFGVEVGKSLFSFFANISASAVIGSAEISVDTPVVSEEMRQFFLSPGVMASVPFGGFSVGLEFRYLYTKDFDGAAVYGLVGIGL